MKKSLDNGMGIGDFAMSLMESGKISKKVQSPETARPKELPVTEVDISEVTIPDSMMNKVLQESFNINVEASKKEIPKKSLLSEQELLQEKIISLREELVETINKLTSLVSEMAGMTGVGTGVTTTGSTSTGYSSKEVTGKYRGRNKHTRTIKRKRTP